MRVVICWMGTSGYLAACWRALAQSDGVQLQILSGTQGRINAPFDEKITAGLDFHLLQDQQYGDVRHVTDLVAQYRPDAVVLCGWTNPAYRHLPFAGELAGAKFIMGMDTPWRNTWRQRMARLKIGRFLKGIDGVVVAGERAWQFARRLGVGEERIFRGMYGVDAQALQNLHAQRLQDPASWPKRFLYMGQYERRKGLDVLTAAYQVYRSRCPDPWPLTCCGSGPEAALLQMPGVENRGFVQPTQQSPVWASAGVFVIASRFDPWPLVVVEAAAAGLPILCSEACGSSVELVRSCFNGLSVGSGQVEPLARAMCWMHEHYPDLPEMGRRGMQLAAAYSSNVWAKRWLNMLRILVNP